MEGKTSNLASLFWNKFTDIFESEVPIRTVKFNVRLIHRFRKFLGKPLHTLYTGTYGYKPRYYKDSRA